MLIKKLKQKIAFIYVVSFLLADINVYTHRHYDSDKILYEKFTKLTGIEVNII